MAPTGYSITADLDVTNMRASLKQAGMKFYPAYLWLVTRTLNRQQEFKIAEKDGQIGYYDTLTPLYAVFHDDDKTFSLMWTEYDDDFKSFYRSYLENNTRYGGNHGILAQADRIPPLKQGRPVPAGPGGRFLFSAAPLPRTAGLAII